VKYLGVWINASLKDNGVIQKQVKSLYCAALSMSALLQYKTLYFVPIACQHMLANWEANTYAQTSMKRLRAAL